MVKAIFETNKSFRDSIFYDVSTWTLPLAFDLTYAALDARTFSPGALKTPIHEKIAKPGRLLGESNPYGYLFSWEDYYAPKALYRLLEADLKVKLATSSLALPVGKVAKEFLPGSIFIPAGNQEKSKDEIAGLMQKTAMECGIDIYGVSTGFTDDGIDLGSPKMINIKKPEVMMVVGNGVSSYDAGEVWHLLDTRYDMPLSMVEVDRLGSIDLSRYTSIVLVNGSYGEVSKTGVDQLKAWARSGGTLIAMERAVQWAKSKDLAHIKMKEQRKSKRNIPRRPYDQLNNDRGAEVIGGAIFQTQLDLTHPLCFGFEDDQLPVFRQGSLFMEMPENPYAAPVWYSDDPLMSGYVSRKNLENFKGAAAVIVSNLGAGRSICMTDNPNFRGFWYGTNKLFANAVFFGSAINGRAGESAGAKK